MNTWVYFDALRTYRTGLKQAQADEKAALHKIERYQGSPAYEDEAQKIRETKQATLDALRKKQLPRITEAVGKMREQIEAMPMDAPTEEELRLVSMLKMRDTLTEAEVRAAANAVKTAAACAAVAEIAQKNGYIAVFRNRDQTIPAAQASQIIDEMERFGRDYLNLSETGPEARARWALNPAYHPDAYPDGPRLDNFRLDKDFESEADVVQYFAGGSAAAFTAAAN